DLSAAPRRIRPASIGGGPVVQLRPQKLRGLVAMKTFLITGGAGFIGSNFLRYLFHRYPDYRFLVLDLLTYAGNVDNLPTSYDQTGGRLEFWYGNVRNAALVASLVERA